MYEYLKLAAAFTIGVGAGILASKRFFQLKYEKIANEEIESVRNSISHRSGHILEETSIEDPEKFASKLIEEIQTGGDYALRTTHVYSTIDNMYMQDLAEKEHPEEDRPDDCYEITEEDYSETALGYDKRTLHYYMEDNMLVEADNGDWTDNDLGPEALEKIRNSEEKTLYFRNDPSAVDYEVIIIDGAYYISM